MGHARVLAIVKNEIIKDITNAVDSAEGREIIIRDIPIKDANKAFRFINGYLVVEDSSGIHNPTDLYSWEELAEIADMFNKGE